MKYYLSDIVEAALADDNTKVFNITRDDELIHPRNEHMTASERKVAYKKAQSYNKQMLILFIMIFFPNTPSDKKSINKIKSEFMNIWIKKSNRYLKLKGRSYPELIFMRFDSKFIKKLSSIMIKEYNYNPDFQFDWDDIITMYNILYSSWNILILKFKLKKIIPTDKDYKDILKEIKKLIMEIK